MTEVLETIAPPYSQEFVSLFLPLVENEEITGTMDKVNHSKHENNTTISNVYYIVTPPLFSADTITTITILSNTLNHKD